MSGPSIFIIAEAGVNHNGSVRTAKKMVDVALAAGADAVKFQTFITEHVLSKNTRKAAYQQKTTGKAESAWDMIKSLELTPREHMEIAAYCRRRGIEYMSTPFDLPSLDLLVRQIRVKRLKIPSGEITNAPLLVRAGQAHLPVLVSTGMANIREIKDALGAIAFGMISRESETPSKARFNRAYHSPQGQKLLRRYVTVLQCTTEYPAPANAMNLRAMATMRQALLLPVGFSDHSLGIAAPIAAAALGAVVIEKHFTLNKKMPGPDQTASLDPKELREMVRGVRTVEAMLGTGVKAAFHCEQKNIPIARKSLVAARPIRTGERFTPENLMPKRPGSGVSPFQYWNYLGRKSKNTYREDDLIKK
ncbi:MAG: N-acetylneuraminate synthase [Omnitrophica bacterium GWA2_52_8]|nr:MAG: N-acetylneuraminate synthase [Omnitrophica bacterium GWA2_52_8]